MVFKNGCKGLGYYDDVVHRRIYSYGEDDDDDDDEELQKIIAESS